MKKFAFSLQKLLNYKVQLFEIEMTVLGEMNVLLYQMQEQLEQLKTNLRLGADRVNTKTKQGTSAQEIIMHKIYLKTLGDDIENKKIQIQFQKLAIEKQTDKVREAKIEISIIEKLKEKKLEEYMAMETKAQELFIEEFVASAKATQLDAQSY